MGCCESYERFFDVVRFRSVVIGSNYWIDCYEIVLDGC